MNLPQPRSQKQSILLGLINNSKGITEQYYGWHSFRHHISVLRRSINIKHTDTKFTSDFGNVGTYRKHWLTEHEKKKAIKLYLSLVKKAA